MAPSGANTAESKEKDHYVNRHLMYPAFAEQIGINLYINAIIAHDRNSSGFKNMNSRFLIKACFAATRVRPEAVSNGAIQMTYSAPHFLEELDPAWEAMERP